MREVSVALVHHPVRSKDGGEVTSTVTNLDVHDIARSARTYGLRSFFVVHPVLAQRALVAKIIDHWTHGASAARIPDRREALRLVEAVPSLETVYDALGGRPGLVVWATGARAEGAALAWEEARRSVKVDGRPLLLIFGTSWGLTRATLDAADAILAPISARADAGYNHLSVRAACAIALDRLLG